MVNRRYEEDNSGATIEASIMRSKEHGLMSEDKSEDRVCCPFLARPEREFSAVFSGACQHDLYHISP
jgi:hypothetical protein